MFRNIICILPILCYSASTSYSFNTVLSVCFIFCPTVCNSTAFSKSLGCRDITLSTLVVGTERRMLEQSWSIVLVVAGALGGPGRSMAGVKSKVNRVLDGERNMKQSITTPAEFKYSFPH